MNAIRCFIALKLPRPVQDHIGEIILRLKDTQANVKWVDPYSTHLTLKFLGEITPELVDCAREALVRQNGKLRSILCTTGQMGVFPNWSRPQVLWLGLNKGAQEITEMQKTIDDGLAECGFARDARKFSPHLTLGRVRSSGNLKNLLKEMQGTALDEVESRLSELALIRSTLMPQGPVYQDLEKIKLL